jgi:hypothetical protein
VNLKIIITTIIAAPILAFGGGGNCYTNLVNDRTLCTDIYYKTVTGPTETKRLGDEKLDQEYEARIEACNDDRHEGHLECDKQLRIDEANADILYYSNIDKANKTWMLMLGTCAITALVPIPGVAQGVAGACAIAATSVLTVAHISISNDFRAANKIAKNNEFECKEGWNAKNANCESRVKRDITRRAKSAQKILDDIVASAFGIEQDCHIRADDRYRLCNSNRQ